ncbi:MAG: NADH-quinone oxidoreductase subunit N [Arachidicoccus sp.]|nr:NADH-quinone oxidoreductase subunit N [Arachidicoccus sp.]
MNAIILSAILGVIMMFCSAFVKNKKSYKVVAFIGLIILLIANIIETYSHSFFTFPLYGMLSFDRFGLYLNSLIIVSVIIYFFLSSSEIEHVGEHVAEYFALIIFSLCGIFILTSFSNLLTLFLGIEIMSIPLYILTGSQKMSLISNEASLKYFLMGSFSTGLMLMGIALIYGGTETFDIAKIVNVHGGNISFLEVTGMLLMVASLCFKVSAAPFHFWTPDVYDGAPSVFTSFMATIIKIGGFIGFIRFLSARAEQTNVDYNNTFGIDWHFIFAIIIIATLIFGNITAIFQRSVKRMLAYSSIAQAGFMLFALFSMNDVSKEGFLLYAVAYSFATIGIFAILSKMSDVTLDGYNGLAKTHPALAFANVIFLLSLAGIPLTAGFFAKYYMLSSAVEVKGYLWLVIAGVIFAAISAYYYFRVIQSMYFKEGTTEFQYEISKPFTIGVIVLAILVILVGVFPQTILNYLYF